MARSWLTDYLSAYPFWLADIGPLSTLSLPILTPVAGFSSITAPEISGEVETFKEGNWAFDRKVLKSASVSPMTLSRGVSIYEADFYYWIKAALYGDTDQFQSPLPALSIGGPTYRRNLMLVHFSNRAPLGQSVAGGDLARAALLGAGVAGQDFAAGLAIGGLTFALTRGLSGFLGTPFEFAARIPARIFVLYGCIPRRYKSGSDFDAKSGDISIQELDIEVEMFEQIGLI